MLTKQRRAEIEALLQEPGHFVTAARWRQAVRDLIQDSDEWREAVRSINFYGAEFCPCCEVVLIEVACGLSEHKPDCPWLRAQQ